MILLSRRIVSIGNLGQRDAGLAKRCLDPIAPSRRGAGEGQIYVH